MAKNRKTKKEKLRTAHRQASPKTTPTSVDTSSSPSPSLYSYTAAATPASSPARPHVITEIIHLREDLSRTLTVTGAIILAELTLLFLLTKM